MNTRLQVEHRVTEMITGIDLVAWQIAVAQGDRLPKKQTEIHDNGHAIQVRLYAEDPENNYLPSTGLLEQVKLAQLKNTLVDSGVGTSDSVTIHYDPMIAKLVVWAKNRNKCISNMQRVLDQSAVFGVKTNLSFLSRILGTHAFRKHQIYTNTLDNNDLDLSQPITPEVVAIYAHHVIHQQSGHSVWQQANGWRLQGTEPLLLELSHQGETQHYSISWEEGQYLINGTDHYLPQEGDFCHIHRNQVQVIHRHRRHEFSLPDHEAVASASSANAILAPMPGKIIEVKVQPGDEVSVGQALVVMEAMKMELELKAEREAVIKDVNCIANDQVKADDVLVELE